ncbi:hypothetical protein A2U01_0096429 [Trifolium medium]|uniref:Uncharacterized protein n=1 Tax=Trifolium medium TaxID=97028 RepID=A0A392UNK5_9FABA|nr:hypothetical protein [Trifolium medium]
MKLRIATSWWFPKINFERRWQEYSRSTGRDSGKNIRAQFGGCGNNTQAQSGEALIIILKVDLEKLR